MFDFVLPCPVFRLHKVVDDFQFSLAGFAVVRGAAARRFTEPKETFMKVIKGDCFVGFDVLGHVEDVGFVELKLRERECIRSWIGKGTVDGRKMLHYLLM